MWLAGETLDLRPLPPLPANVLGGADLNGDGRLDLVGLSQGRPVRLIGSGQNSYHWQMVHPRAQQSAGDQRISRALRFTLAWAIAPASTSPGSCGRTAWRRPNSTSRRIERLSPNSG
jgi:hypothetical protein